MLNAIALRRTILEIILKHITSDCFTTWDVSVVLQRNYNEVYSRLIRKYGRSRYSFRNYLASQLMVLERKGYIFRSNNVCGKRRGFVKKPRGVKWGSPCIAEWCKRKKTILDYIYV